MFTTNKGAVGHLISYDLLHEIEGEIRSDRRVTIKALHHIIPEVS
jgi:hypothetical protein